MKILLILAAILGIDILILSLELSELSISYYETQILSQESSLLHYIVTASLSFFGHNDFALRLPMVIMHLLSVVLLFKVSSKYLKNGRDRLWLVTIYILLPGVNSAALIVNGAGLMIMALFFYMYIYHFYRRFEYLVVTLLLFFDPSIIFLYLGLFFFEYQNRSYKKMLYLLMLFLGATIFHHYEISGAPSGHFIDALGVYAAVFSPIVFIYLFYILYRGYMRQHRDVSWYLASTALVISLLLSFRQRIDVAFYAPYVMVALPLATQAFFSSYRVRLKEYRKSYKILFSISFILLLIHTMIVLFNKEFYPYMTTPKKHFAYKMHIAKELANKLHALKITCISIQSQSMQSRLQFYGITHCQKNELANTLQDKNRDKNVTISYKNKILYEAYVTKTHN
jgi:hypothetical protein